MYHQNYRLQHVTFSILYFINGLLLLFDMKITKYLPNLNDKGMMDTPLIDDLRAYYTSRDFVRNYEKFIKYYTVIRPSALTRVIAIFVKENPALMIKLFLYFLSYFLFILLSANLAPIKVIVGRMYIFIDEARR